MTEPALAPIDLVALSLRLSNVAGDDQPELSASQLLRLIMDNIPQAVFWKDRNSVYIYCNRAFAIDAGVDSPEDIHGKTDHDLAWTAEQADFFHQVDQRVMAQDTAEFGFVEPQRQADNKLAWLVTNKIPLHDSQGAVDRHPRHI